MDLAPVIEGLFNLPNKDGVKVPFILNGVQRKLHQNLARKNIVPKARQRGISYYVLALYLAKCLAQENRRAVIVSHSALATQKLLDRAHYLIEKMNGPKPDLKYNTRQELYFRKTDSTMYIGTAGTDDFGVGDTVTDLHGSEVAFWPNPQSLLKGLFNAVSPTGTIILESTGKGMGNYYHRMCMRANDGISDYKLHFFTWTDAEEYQTPLTLEEAKRFLTTLDPELEEVRLYEDKVLTLEQLRWRRDKIVEMDYDLKSFKEQYPLTLDECFQGTGASYFNRINSGSGKWKKHPDIRHLFTLGDHPKPHHLYVAGIDAGAGVGRDDSVLEIYSLDTGDQVAELAVNNLEPHVFAMEAARVLSLFDNPYLNVERNTYGLMVIKELFDNDFPRSSMHYGRRPSGKAQREFNTIADFGTYTNTVTRGAMIEAFRKRAVEEWTIHSSKLRDQMNSFVEKDNGKVEAQEGCNDDTVMASAVAAYVADRAALRAGRRDAQVEEDARNVPFSLEGILYELETRYNDNQQAEIGNYFSSQVVNDE